MTNPDWGALVNPSPTIHNPPAEVRGATDPYTPQKVGVLGKIILDLTLAQVALALSGVTVLGTHPFAFLGTWAQKLQKDAQQAYDTAWGTSDGINVAINGGDATSTSADYLGVFNLVKNNIGLVHNNAKGGLSLAKGRARAGSNFVNDPHVRNFDFWSQDYMSLSDKHHSGLTSVQLTGQPSSVVHLWFNTIHDGSVQPIDANAGDVFLVEAWVMAATDSLGTVTLVAQPITAGTAGTDVTLDSKTFAQKNNWAKLSAYFTIPDGVDSFSAGIRIPAGAGIFNADDMVIRELTHLQATWTKLWRAHSGNTSDLTDKTIDDVASAAGTVRGWAFGAKSDLQTTWNKLWRAHSGANTDPTTDKSAEDVATQAGIVRGWAFGAKSDLQTTWNKLWRAHSGASTDPTTDKSAEDVATEAGKVRGWAFGAKSDLQTTWNRLWRAHTGSNDTADKSIDDVASSAGALRGWALGGQLTARGRAKHANNYVSDSKAEHPEFWTQTNVAQFGLARHTGSYSVAVTSQGATPTYCWFNTIDDGSVQPLAARTQEVFYVEAYISGYTQNQGLGTVALVGRAINSETGVYDTDTVIDSVTITQKGAWYRLSGYYVMPTSGYDTFSAGVYLAANAVAANDRILVDDMIIRETTDLQRTWNKLVDGLAGGTNSHKGTDDVANAAGIVRGWAHGGYLTARGRAKAANNFISDPDAESADFWTQDNITRSLSNPHTGNASLKMTSLGNAADTYLWFNTVDDGSIQPISTRASEVFYIEAYVASNTGNTAGGVARLVGDAINSVTGATQEATIIAYTFSAGKVGPYYKLSGYLKMPTSGAYDKLNVGIKLAKGETVAGQIYWVDNMVCREATDHQRLWNRLHDGLTAASGGDGISVDDVATAAGVVRGWAWGGYNMVRSKSRAGANLVLDPDIEISDYWTQPYVQQSNAVDPYSSSYCLAVTSANPTRVFAFFNVDESGAVDPIKARFNDWYFVQCYIYSPSGNTNGTVSLIGLTKNTKTNATSSKTIAAHTFSNLTKGAWRELSGYFKMDSLGHNTVSFGIALGTTNSDDTVAGQVYYVDQLTVRETTAAQKLTDTLKDAFDGVLGSDGTTAADLWASANGIRGWAKSGYTLGTKRVSAAANYISDGKIRDAGFWTQPQTSVQAVAKHTGQYGLQIQSQGTTATYVWWNTLDDGTVSPVAVNEDEYVHLSCWVKAPGGVGTVKLIGRAINTDTAQYADTVVNTQTFSNSVWQHLYGVYQVPAGADQLQVGLLLDTNSGFAAGTYLFADELTMREATSVQRTIDNIHQSFGGTGTGKDPDVVKTGFAAWWSGLFDAHSGNTVGTSSNKTPTDVYSAAAGVRNIGVSATSAASAAQTTANSATSSATTANNSVQTTWNSLYDSFNNSTGSDGITSSQMATKAKAVKTTADGASSAASTAQSTANSATSAASTAQSTANSASSAASTAQSTANSASSAATTANNSVQTTWDKLYDSFNGSSGSNGATATQMATKATAVKNTADTASSTATSASSAASTAQSTANSASSSATTANNSVQTTWNTLYDSFNGSTGSNGITSTQVGTKATAVKNTADTASSTATSANSAAGTAQSTANSATSAASTADGKAVVADTFATVTSASSSIFPDPDFTDTTIRRSGLGTSTFYSTAGEPAQGNHSLKLYTATGSISKWTLNQTKLNGTSVNYPIAPGMVFNFDIYMQAKSSNTGSGNLEVYFTLYDVAGNSYGNSVITVKSVAVSKGTWQHLAGSYTIPDYITGSVVPFSMIFSIGAASVSAGDTFFVDRAFVYR